MRVADEPDEVEREGESEERAEQAEREGRGGEFMGDDAEDEELKVWPAGSRQPVRQGGGMYVRVRSEMVSSRRLVGRSDLGGPLELGGTGERTK